MDYPQAVAMLQQHASIRQLEDAKPETSFTYALWQYRKNATDADFVGMYQEILKCLEIVNRHINGPTPSASQEQAAIDSNLALALSTILDEGLDFNANRVLGKRFEGDTFLLIMLVCWAVSTAWRAVLEGDIDSLSEHVRDAGVAKDFPIEMLC